MAKTTNLAPKTADTTLNAAQCVGRGLGDPPLMRPAGCGPRKSPKFGGFFNAIDSWLNENRMRTLETPRRPPDGACLPADTYCRLRQWLARMEAHGRAAASALRFDIPEVDAHVPGGGLALGHFHEVIEDGAASEYAGLATLFAAGIAARLTGPVLWCLRGHDLFAPALARIGLDHNRVIYCETWKDGDVLPAMEEGLKCKGLAAVVGEVTRLSLKASRRLQLHQSARRISAVSSSSGVAFTTSRSGRSDCACVTVMPRLKAEALRSHIDARQHAALSLHDGRHERLIPRGEFFARPPQPIRRPMRQVKRDDPSHRMPPKPKNAVRRRAPATTPHANVGGLIRRTFFPATDAVKFASALPPRSARPHHFSQSRCASAE